MSFLHRRHLWCWWQPQGWWGQRLRRRGIGRRSTSPVGLMTKAFYPKLVWFSTSRRGLAGKSPKMDMDSLGNCGTIYFYCFEILNACWWFVFWRCGNLDLYFDLILLWTEVFHNNLGQIPSLKYANPTHYLNSIFLAHHWLIQKGRNWNYYWLSIVWELVYILEKDNLRLAT